MRLSGLLMVPILGAGFNAFSAETTSQPSFNSSVRCIMTVSSGATGDSFSSGRVLELNEKLQSQDVLGFTLEAQVLPTYWVGTTSPILDEHVQKIVVSISRGGFKATAKRLINDKKLVAQELTSELNDGAKRAEVLCRVFDK